MEHAEFDAILTALGLGAAEVAREMRALGGGRTSASYVSAMRNGRKPVTQAAAIYARLKQRGANGPDITRADVLDYLARHLPGAP